MRQGLLTATLLSVAAMGLASPGAAAPVSFDCDVPADRYSSISQDIEGTLAISGSVTPVVLRQGNNQPVAGARLINPDDTASAGFQLIAAFSKATQFDIVLNNRQGQDLKRYIVGQVPANEPIRFSLSLSPDGTLAVTINGAAYEAGRTAFPSGRAMVFCSTGQFKFSDVRFAADADGAHADRAH